jgi:molecular chaperone DnaK (HSP70)
MRVGIDFGTTHTVIAVIDCGNYPVVSFDDMDTWPGVDAAAVRHEPTLTTQPAGFQRTFGLQRRVAAGV